MTNFTERYEKLKATRPESLYSIVTEEVVEPAPEDVAEQVSSEDIDADVLNIEDEAIENKALEDEVIEDDTKEDNTEEVEESLIEDSTKDAEKQEIQTVQPNPDTLLILEAFDRLVSKIDELMQNPPVVNLPAPIIEMTMPEMRKIVSKDINRDAEGNIKSITETTVEKPVNKMLSEKAPPKKSK